MEFKKYVPTPIKTYVEEQKATELQRAASLADDYKLTRMSSTTVADSRSGKTGIPLIQNKEVYHTNGLDPLVLIAKIRS